MRRLRPLLLATSAVIALAAVPAVAAAPVAPALRGTLVQLKARTRLPILLPATLPVTRVAHRPLYPRITTDARSWNVDLGLAPGCDGANACSAGSLGAVRSSRPLTGADGQRVGLRGGVVGRYRPLSCGASCSPPSITFATAGVHVSFQLKLDARPSRTDRGTLARLADQALAAGPR